MPELDPDQVNDVELLLNNPRWGLFHEQGVGKTPPAIVAATRVPGRKLITVPAYLIPQWEDYLRVWAPGCTVARMDGERSARTAALKSDSEFVLSSYHNWVGKGTNGWVYPFDKHTWGALIFDEAHRLRGRNSQWTKRIYQLDNVDSKNKGVPMWFLTGTPEVRDAGDFFPFLHLCDRKVFTSYWNFVQEHCVCTNTPWDTIVGRTKDPAHTMSILRRYSNRRELKLDTDRVFIDVPVQLPMSVVQMIRKAKKEFVFEHPDMEEDIWFESAGAVWGKCREMTSLPPTQANPKLDALRGLLEDLPNERVIVAAWYRNTANAAFDVVKNKLKRPGALFTGDTRVSAKQDALDLYRHYDDAVIVCTIAALKEGANLQAGNHMIFLEESELPADNAQLISRQYRRGQTKPVVVYRVHASGASVDEAVHRLATKRADDVRKVMAEYLTDIS